MRQREQSRPAEGKGMERLIKVRGRSSMCGLRWMSTSVQRFERRWWADSLLDDERASDAGGRAAGGDMDVDGAGPGCGCVRIAEAVRHSHGGRLN